MSDEEDNEEGSAPEPQAPKKSRLGLVLATVVVVVLVTGAAVAGTMFGPALMGHGKKAEAGEKEKEKEKEKPIGETVELSPILVDARAKNGEIHHLKVVLAIEVGEGTAKEEFMKYSPRGREAAVAYLRSLTFEEEAAPERYDDVRAELAKRFTEAVGAKKIARVMVIDFVAQ